MRHKDACASSPRFQSRFPMAAIQRPSGDQAGPPHAWRPRPGETWRTAFSFATDHRPGALHKAIEPFGRHELDLVQLVSRPIPSTPWRYRFDAVLAGHPLDPIVTETLAEVQGLTRELRVFGSYPAHA